MERQQRVVGVLALVVAAVLAVVVVVGFARALDSGRWALVSSAFVLMAAAVSQWVAVGARRRGGRHSRGGFALLVALGLVGLTLCGLDFVTGDRSNRAFTALFAAGLVAVVGGVLGSYRRAGQPDATSPDGTPS